MWVSRAKPGDADSHALKLHLTHEKSLFSRADATVARLKPPSTESTFVTNTMQTQLHITDEPHLYFTRPMPKKVYRHEGETGEMSEVWVVLRGHIHQAKGGKGFRLPERCMYGAGIGSKRPSTL